MRKTRHEISIDIRIFLQCTVKTSTPTCYDDDDDNDDDRDARRGDGSTATLSVYRVSSGRTQWPLQLLLLLLVVVLWLLTVTHLHHHHLRSSYRDPVITTRVDSKGDGRGRRFGGPHSHPNEIFVWRNGASTVVSSQKRHHGGTCD